MFKPPTNPYFIKRREHLEDTLRTVAMAGGLDGLAHQVNGSGYSEGIRKSIFTETALIALIYANHHKLGHPVVEPELSLAKAMADYTDLSIVQKTGLPQLPAPVVWLVFPPGVDLYLPSSPDDPDPRIRATGAYISHSSVFDSIFKFDSLTGAGAEDGWMVYLWGCGRDPHHDRYFHMGFSKDQDLDAEGFGKDINDHVEVNLTHSIDLQAADRAILKRAMRLIVGTLLYMSCSDQDFEVSTPQNRTDDFKRRSSGKKNLTKGAMGLEKKWLDQYGHSTITYVGRGWDRKQGKKFTAEVSSSTENQAEVGVARRLHWVRGHFRDQPHGEGRLLRKRVYIEPHLRGDVEQPVPVTFRVR